MSNEIGSVPQKTDIPKDAEVQVQSRTEVVPGVQPELDTQAVNEAVKDRVKRAYAKGYKEANEIRELQERYGEPKGAPVSQVSSPNEEQIRSIAAKVQAEAVAQQMQSFVAQRFSSIVEHAKKDEQFSSTFSDDVAKEFYQKIPIATAHAINSLPDDDAADVVKELVNHPSMLNDLVHGASIGENYLGKMVSNLSNSIRANKVVKQNQKPPINRMSPPSVNVSSSSTSPRTASEWAQRFKKRR